MRRGFALFIALIVLVMAGILTTLMLAFTTVGGDLVRTEQEGPMAKKAAEIGLRMALERVSQQATQTYFSDPRAGYYWFGGDLDGDGFISNDGEVPGRDYGMDNVQDIIEYGFDSGALSGGAVFDPARDNTQERGGGGAATGTEGNGQLDWSPTLFVPDLPGGELRNTGVVDGYANGGQTSFQESYPFYYTGVPIPYQPISNPDPDGDDYHPLLNPLGLEGRVDGGAPPLPTIEDGDVRWRRHTVRVGELGRFDTGITEGYTAVKAVDTSSKIDLNGPPLLTARLLNGLILTTGLWKGPITSTQPHTYGGATWDPTAGNPPIGRNGKGIEAEINFAGFPPIAGVNPKPAPFDTAIDLLHFPQYYLWSNPAFYYWLEAVDDATFTGTPPRKIAATKREEELFFLQPVTDSDPDAVAIIKYRDQQLGGRFTSVSQLLQVPRADGSMIFDVAARDELVRIVEFLATESWRDPNTISRRNSEPLVYYDAGVVVAGNPVFVWDLNSNAGGGTYRSAVSYRDPEPWQDIRVNGIFEGGEPFDDFGFDGRTSSASQHELINDNALHPANKEGVWDQFTVFAIPDPNLDDFHPIWNPFFMRKFGLYYGLLPYPDVGTVEAKKIWTVRNLRQGLYGWSPFSFINYMSQGGLQHAHYSDLEFGYSTNPRHSGQDLRQDKSGGSGLYWDRERGFNFVWLDREEYLFNYDALDGNGIFDLDPYIDGPGAPGTMLAERWFNPAVGYNYNPYDVGLDTVNSRDFVGLDICDPCDPVEPSRFEFYYNLSLINPANDPNFDDYLDWNTDLDADGNPDNVVVPLRQVSCLPPPGNSAFGFRRNYGTEWNNRYDPFPEIGYAPAGNEGLFFDPRWNGLYSGSTDAFTYIPGFFLKPNFDLLPLLLDPPGWAGPDLDWFAEPGEFFQDHGRDRLINTGDPGEGNGRWDPGEEFADGGLDNRSDSAEQAFQDFGLTTEQANCSLSGAGSGTQDLHSDNFGVVAGVGRGSEENGLFDLLREPYQDLDRNGRWSRPNTIQADWNGVDWVMIPIDPAAANIKRENPAGYGTYRDIDGDRAFDSGVFREPRAPININAAPEQVIAANILEGMMVPAKRSWDRFTVTNFDVSPGNWGSLLEPSTFDDYDWTTIIYENDAIVTNARNPHLRFAETIARQFARAVFLRRMSLPPYDGSLPGVAIGQFWSWQDYEAFVRGLFNDVGGQLTAVQNTLVGQRDSRGNLINVDPFSLAAPPDVLNPVQLVIDRILIQSNPNSRLRNQGNYAYVNATQFDKADFPFPMTEFCFGPTGYFDLTAVGYAVATLGQPAPNIPAGAQVEPGVFLTSNANLMVEPQVMATVELERTVKVFDHHRLSTRSDFLATRPETQNVSIQPKRIGTSDMSLGAQIGIFNKGDMSDFRANTNPFMPTTAEPFLWVKPWNTVFSPERGMMFVSSNAPYQPGWASGPGNPDAIAPAWPPEGIGGRPETQIDHGGLIQAFTFRPVEMDGFDSPFVNIVTNNGIPRQLDLPRMGGSNNDGTDQSYRFGVIEPGNGMDAGAAPLISAMAFDPHFPEPANFPNLRAWNPPPINPAGGSWLNGANITLDNMFQPVDGQPTFRTPPNIAFLGRLYFLDETYSSFSPTCGAGVCKGLRAVDIGLDEVNGLISQEVEFLANLSYPGNYTGLALEVAPERREVYGLFDDGGGRLRLIVYRYPEGNPYPPQGANGESTLVPGADLPLDLPPPYTNFPRHIYGGLENFNPRVRMLRDPGTGFVYVGYSVDFGDADNRHSDVVVLRYHPDTGDIAKIFPYINEDDTLNTAIRPPGYDAVTRLRSLNSAGGDDGPTDPTAREFVGMELDPGSNLLFVLWNLNIEPAHQPDPGNDPGPEGISYIETNGPGAYLAAVPLGAAPYISTPLANPMPMDLPVSEIAWNFVPDTSPLYAADLAVDYLNKTIMVAPREQMCRPSPINEAAVPPNPNRVAKAKNYMRVLTYGENGLRIVDPLNSFEYVTDQRDFYDPWDATLDFSQMPDDVGFGGELTGDERPLPVGLTAFPGKNYFFTSIRSAHVNDLEAPDSGAGCVWCPCNVRDQQEAVGDAGLGIFPSTRQIISFEVGASSFATGNKPPEEWIDGKLTADPNALPLSTYIPYLQARSYEPFRGATWIHSRANFDASPFFVEQDYPLLRTPALEDNPLSPVGMRTVFTQNNARVEAEGLRIDNTIPPVNTAITNDISDFYAPGPPGPYWPDQRVVFPQDGTGHVREIRTGRVANPPDGVNPTAQPNLYNVENGWRPLRGAGEFWLRTGDLTNFWNTIGDLTKEIVLYENFQKVKARLQDVYMLFDTEDSVVNADTGNANPDGLADTHDFDGAPPVTGGEPNLFKSHIGNVFLDPTDRKQSLINILAEAQNSLGHPVGAHGVAPQNFNSPDPNSLDKDSLEFSFCPDSMELWAYDRIMIRDFNPLAETATFVYERWLAAPMGQYPGLFRVGIDNFTTHYGTFEPCYDYVIDNAQDNPDEVQRPFSKDSGITYLQAANRDLANRFERLKYPVVRVTDKDGGPYHYWFAPIFNNTHNVPKPRNASRAAFLTNIPLNGEWTRILYNYDVDHDPLAGGGSALMVPDISLHIWNQGMPVAYLESDGIPYLNFRGIDWWDFPGDREGFLAFGAWKNFLQGNDPATDWEYGLPSAGGPIRKEFNYIVDDVVLYNYPLIEDFSLDIQLNHGVLSPAPNTIARYGIPEGGWPLIMPPVGTGHFPGVEQPASPIFPPEPFFDHDLDGTRSGFGGRPTIADGFGFWDLNGNLNFDFLEPVRLQWDTATFGLGGTNAYAEPFVDIDGSTTHTAGGDILMDLNANGLLDGEGFQDADGDWVFSAAAGDVLDDRNGNGLLDGFGEPFIDVVADNVYTPRFGEPFRDIGVGAGNAGAQNNTWDAGEPFVDQNLNGAFDFGEHIADWSRTPLDGIPEVGELYRENLMSPGWGPMTYWNPGANNLDLIFPSRYTPGNVWNTLPGPASVDWNNDGRYQAAGSFEGNFSQPIPMGSRIGSIAFTVWRPQNPGDPDLQGRVSVDLEIHGKDGRNLGRWTGVDNLDTSLGVVVPVDESGFGMPVPLESTVRARVNFFMPSPFFDPGPSIYRPTSAPVLDDLTFTVILPNAVILSEREKKSLLFEDVAHGGISR